MSTNASFSTPIPNSAHFREYSLAQLYLLTYRTFTHTPPCAALIRLCLSRILRIHAVSERHAAASYGHLDILTYLISKGNKSRRWLVSADHPISGGNVNVTDEDGDTPLYTVENIETARLLVDNGADSAWRNHEGLTVCQALVIHAPPPLRLR